MHAAFDHVPVQHPVGEARRRVGTFIIGDIKRSGNVVDRQPAIADLKILI